MNIRDILSSSLHLIVLYVTLLIVSAHGVLSLCYELLHWPKWLVRHLEGRQERNVQRVLNQLGYDNNVLSTIRRRQEQARLRESVRVTDPRERCVNLLRKALCHGNFRVGIAYTWNSPYFLDVMSACMNWRVADECADILTSYLTEQGASAPTFTKVVGIKPGSPTIAYQFAKRVGKPLALFRGTDNYKFNRADADPATLFDGVIEPGDEILIVDDSTTGGAMMIDCTDALCCLGATVSASLVLFEPVGLDARLRLKNKGVPMLAVITMDEAGMKEVGIGGRTTV